MFFPREFIVLLLVLFILNPYSNFNSKNFISESSILTKCVHWAVREGKVMHFKLQWKFLNIFQNHKSQWKIIIIDIRVSNRKENHQRTELSIFNWNLLKWYFWKTIDSICELISFFFLWCFDDFPYMKVKRMPTTDEIKIGNQFKL